MSKKISLTRVLAEIKSIEEKALEVKPMVATSNPSGVVDSMTTKEQFAKASQAAYDKFVASMERLVKLKAARNKANATVTLIVDGKEVTIDTAVALKSQIATKRAFINAVRQQIGQAERAVQKAEDLIGSKLEKHNSSNPTAEQLEALREMYKKTDGRTIVIGSNIQSGIDSMEKELDAFELEIDFALSEVNAKTEVEV